MGTTESIPPNHLKPALRWIQAAFSGLLHHLSPKKGERKERCHGGRERRPAAQPRKGLTKGSLSRGQANQQATGEARRLDKIPEKKSTTAEVSVQKSHDQGPRSTCCHLRLSLWQIRPSHCSWLCTVSLNIFVNNRQLNPGRNSVLSASSTDCCRKNDTTPSFGQTCKLLQISPISFLLTQLAGEGCQFFHGDRLFLCVTFHDQTSPSGSLFTFVAGSLSRDVEREPVRPSQDAGTQLSHAWPGAKKDSRKKHWAAEILHLQINATMKTKCT